MLATVKRAGSTNGIDGSLGSTDASSSTLEDASVVVFGAVLACSLPWPSSSKICGRASALVNPFAGPERLTERRSA